MASSGDLARAVAIGTGLPIEVVQSFVKGLRTEGLLASAGRGPGAARMQLPDAAALVTAVLATPSAVRAPEAVRRVFGYVSDGMAVRTGRNAYGFVEDRPVRFEAALTAVLLRLASSLRPGAGAVDLPELTLSYETPARVASIVIGPKGYRIDFRDRRTSPVDADGAKALGLVDVKGDLIQIRSISRRTLALVAREIADSQSVASRADRHRRSPDQSFEA